MNYQKICSYCLKDLTPRPLDVMERRFGLKGGERETLEAIGATHSITRERVRQIELEGILKIKPQLENNQELFNDFKKVVESTISRLNKEKKTFSLEDLLKDQKLNKDIFASYIGISKNIQKNSE